MIKLLLLMLAFASCERSYIEKTGLRSNIPASISYDTREDGILLEWQSDEFTTIDILRGETVENLQPYKTNLVQTELLDVSVVAGVENFYKIISYNTKGKHVGTSVVLKGKKSYRAIDSVVIPTDLRASKNSYGDQVDLVWSGSYLDIFRIYRSDSADGEFVLIDEVNFKDNTELFYQDKNLSIASEYFYKVSVVGKSNIGETEKYTDIAIGTTINIPTGLVASQGDIDIPGGIHLSWPKNASASHFMIYRADSSGEYQFLTMSFDDYYIDNKMPNVDGTIVGSTVEYPKYSYKIKSVTAGVESDISAAAEGWAIDPKFSLAAPQLSISLDKSSHPYKINLSWQPLADNTVKYNLIKIVGDKTNNIASDTAVANYTFDNEPFNTSVNYELRAINHAKGGVVGTKSMQNYRSSTPSPPVNVNATKNERIISTNTDMVEKPVVVYYKKTPTSSVQTIEAGTIQSYTEKAEVGFINLSWEPVANEQVTSYNVYRREKGFGDFKLLQNTTQRFLKDNNFTPEQLAGSGEGDTFAYPVYEYKISALVGDNESLLSTPFEGSAIDPKDIIAPPANVTIAGHWAIGLFGFARNGVWTLGPASPEEAKLINNTNKNGMNQHLYLVWSDVSEASNYQLRHKIAIATNWVEHSNYYPTTAVNRTRTQQFNNDTSSPASTYLYSPNDSISYVPNSVEFDIASFNGRAKVLGNRRRIQFKENPNNPF